VTQELIERKKGGIYNAIFNPRSSQQIEEKRAKSKPLLESVIERKVNLP